MGMNSARMDVKATTTRKGWRRRMALEMPVMAWSGGERRRERAAGWGD
jgi:hypothetical protein